jgi:hypothetical protein
MQVIEMLRERIVANAKNCMISTSEESRMKDLEFENIPIALVPLAQAVLCVDCERISEQSGGHFCAGCGSGHLINLAAVLNPAHPAEAIPVRQ